MTERLNFKWGTLKGWSGLSEKSVAIGGKLKLSYSAMAQDRNDDHKAVLCELIDSVAGSGGVLKNDWTGEIMTADEAKKYVMEYMS